MGEADHVLAGGAIEFAHPTAAVKACWHGADPYRLFVDETVWGAQTRSDSCRDAVFVDQPAETITSSDPVNLGLVW
jgi:hypothetical protein